MDKAMSFGGFGGAVFNEVRNALYDAKEHPTIVNYIFGFGGRDANPRELRKIYDDLLQINKTGNVETTVHFLGLKGVTEEKKMDNTRMEIHSKRYCL